MKSGMLRSLGAALFAVALLATGAAQAQTRKPNILVIWGDDIGGFNISAYNRGMMGYRTPNIDSIAEQGALFTDWYGQQSCTAGRAAFITGQSPIRTGLTKVGLPGAPEGMKAEDPTIATLLKAQGYVTGQFGKNHLGDRDEMLPTAHGFDEFFGNLYHLNAEEEPENPDYFKNPELKKKFGPRGVIHSYADGRITDTGPLTKKRMETVDEEVTAAALDFMERAKKDDKPFFIWWNSTRMHIFTHLKPESEGKTGLGIYADGMVEHDAHGGPAARQAQGTRPRRQHHRDVLDRQRRRDLHLAGRRHDDVPRREEHAVGRRLSRPDADPLAGRHQAGHRDQRHRRARGHADDAARRGRRHHRQPRTCSRAARSARRPTRCTSTATTSCPRCRGQAPWPRHEFIYWTDDGSVAALRYDNWKITFLEQKARGPEGLAGALRRELRAPKITNLRMDPFERADEENAHGLPALVHGAHVRHRAGRRLRRPVAAELQGVPAAPEAGQLQPRSRDGSGDRRNPVQVNLRAERH